MSFAEVPPPGLPWPSGLEPSGLLPLWEDEEADVEVPVEAAFVWAQPDNEDMVSAAVRIAIAVVFLIRLSLFILISL